MKLKRAYLQKYGIAGQFAAVLMPYLRESAVLFIISLTELKSGLYKRRNGSIMPMYIYLLMKNYSIGTRDINAKPKYTSPLKSQSTYELKNIL